MLELLVLGVSGLCFGAGLSAAKHAAPRRMVVLWFVLSATALVLAILTFEGNS